MGSRHLLVREPVSMTYDRLTRTMTIPFQVRIVRTYLTFYDAVRNSGCLLFPYLRRAPWYKVKESLPFNSLDLALVQARELNGRHDF